MISFLKYLGELKGARTPDGFPIRGGQAPPMRREEYDDLGYSVDARVRVFATDKPEDMAEYAAVLDRVANGLYVHLAPDREEFVPARGAWLILVRWGEVKGDLPQHMVPAGGFQ